MLGKIVAAVYSERQGCFYLLDNQTVKKLVPQESPNPSPISYQNGNTPSRNSQLKLFPDSDYLLVSNSFKSLKILNPITEKYLKIPLKVKKDEIFSTFALKNQNVAVVSQTGFFSVYNFEGFDNESETDEKKYKRIQFFNLKKSFNYFQANIQKNISCNFIDQNFEFTAICPKGRYLVVLTTSKKGRKFNSLVIFQIGSDSLLNYLTYYHFSKFDVVRQLKEIERKKAIREKTKVVKKVDKEDDDQEEEMQDKSQKKGKGKKGKRGKKERMNFEKKNKAKNKGKKKGKNQGKQNKGKDDKKGKPNQKDKPKNEPKEDLKPLVTMYDHKNILKRTRERNEVVGMEIYGYVSGLLVIQVVTKMEAGSRKKRVITFVYDGEYLM